MGTDRALGIYRCCWDTFAMVQTTSLMPRRSLALLVMAAAIPVLVFGGWVAFLNAQQDRKAARQAAFETLDRVATRVTSELGTQIELAEALAASAALDQPDLQMFYREAKRLKDAHPLWETIELVDTEGHQVLNLLRPMGAQLGATADRDNFNQVLRTHRAAIGGIGPLGPISGKRLVALRAPVEREGRTTFVLTVALVPDAVSQILRNAGAPEGWVGVVADAKGNIVARTLEEQFELGQPASESVRAAIKRAPEGAYIGRTLEGRVDVLDIEVDRHRRPLERLRSDRVAPFGKFVDEHQRRIADPDHRMQQPALRPGQPRQLDGAKRPLVKLDGLCRAITDKMRRERVHVVGDGFYGLCIHCQLS